MKKVAILCPLEGLEQLAQTQWVQALKKMGHTTRIFNLRSRGVDPHSKIPALVQEICCFDPDLILVEGVLGFNLPEFYFQSEIQGFRIGSFWFDDPFRSLESRSRKDPLFEALRLGNVHHFVWDGYWREWLQREYQIKSHPIHLAADPEDFYPGKKEREFENETVFVGTLISQKRIEQIRAGFSPALRYLSDLFDQEYEKSPYAASPYQILQSLLQTLPLKWSKAFEVVREKDPDAVRFLHVYVWMKGKNETRLRILKAALQQDSLVMLSGSLEGSHASGEEIQEKVGGCGKNLIFRDSTSFEFHLTDLYRYGKIHIQATDPQSVYGGIPFRVFQTTACGVPLLTDQKRELGECFEYENELFTFHSDEDFGERLQKVRNDRDRLEQVSENGYRRFLKEHTWTHRLEHVFQTMRLP